MTKPFIVAEIGASHNGSLERALDLVDRCAAAGVHAVKFQTWEAGTMVLDPALVLRTGPWIGRNLAELYAQAHTPWHWHPPLFQRAAERGIEAFSSVFDVGSLAFLESINCPRYKVASFEIVDLPLIQAIAETGKPLILSTGMATRSEIDIAVRTAKSAGCKDLTLLKCTSAYPADGASANLATMRTLSHEWGARAGLSDHTVGIGVAIAAAALGASMIEKHVTLDRTDGSLDAAFSIEPQELAQLAREAANVASAFGTPHHFGPSIHEQPQVELRRSLYFTWPLPAGTTLERRHMRSARPALGLPPSYAGRLIGSTLRRDVGRGEPINWESVILKPALEAYAAKRTPTVS